jgi:hypothetical protein
MAIRPDSRLSRTPPQEFRLCHNRVFLRDYDDTKRPQEIMERLNAPVCWFADAALHGRGTPWSYQAWDNPDDYMVHDGDRIVGRIFRADAGAATGCFAERTGRLPERVAAERWLLPVAGARAGQLGYPAGAVAGLTAEKLRSGRLLVNPRDRLRGGEQ